MRNNPLAGIAAAMAISQSITGNQEMMFLQEGNYGCTRKEKPKPKKDKKTQKRRAKNKAARKQRKKSK